MNQFYYCLNDNRIIIKLISRLLLILIDISLKLLNLITLQYSYPILNNIIIVKCIFVNY